jgi:hypothetical protein
MQIKPSRHSLFTCVLGLITSLAPSALWAIDYGIYDARALAMGGTAVAIGNTAQAQFYNPALLGLHRGDEDENRDGRTYFPVFVLQASGATDTAISAVNDKLDQKLTDAINRYNAARNSGSAASLASSSSELRHVLGDIANEDLQVDGFLGLSVSEPSDHEGGAFYVGARAIAVGTSKITPTDLALLDQYIAAANELAAGATHQSVAAKYPTLVKADGSFVDPTTNLTSSADISALAISEWGMAVGKEFTFWGQAISLGITPKLMRVDAYRERAEFRNTNINNINDSLNQLEDSKTTRLTFNADLGIAAVFAEHYRVSLAMKDALAKEFKTHQTKDPVTGLARPDLLVKLNPRTRMGIGYVTERLSIGVDYDLQASKPMGDEAENQDISVGLEYRLLRGFALRAGYRQDQTGLNAKVTTAGVGYQWRRFVAELGYASSSDAKGAGLQMGWAF